MRIVKTTTKVFFILLISSFSLEAYDVHQYDMDRKQHENHNNGYQGSSGQRYQYDLSKPSDRIDYMYDKDAQRRDSQYDYSGNSQRDSMYGQHGGGRYDD